jgi:ribosome-associated protein
METFEVHSEYIELNKLMKVLGWAQTGGHAKLLIQNGEVLRDGEIETRVRAKIPPGTVICWDDMEIKVVAKTNP